MYIEIIYQKLVYRRIEKSKEKPKDVAVSIISVAKHIVLFLYQIKDSIIKLIRLRYQIDRRKLYTF